MEKLRSLFSHIFNTLRLGPHHRIERFGIMFISLSLLMMFVVGSAFTIDLKNKSVVLSEQAVYTTRVVTSKTNINGTVEQVYASDDDTKVFVLLKFNDVSKISIDAENYQMFLTAADIDRNKNKLQSNPSGSIYMFGNTGYMGIYLVNGSGFEQQILDLVVRANSEIIPVNQSRIQQETNDGSFLKHDQFRLYFNPGGSLAEPLDCLNEEGAPSAIDLYTQTVSSVTESKIRDELDSMLSLMNTDLIAISEYTNRLVNNTPSVIVPEPSAVIANDTITTNENGEFVLNTTTTVARGFNFDWRSGSIAQKRGYLDSLAGANTYSQFFASKNREVSAGEFISGSRLVWELSDGTNLEDLNSGSDSTTYSVINSNINLLVQARQSYYDHKKSYQIDLLGRLLRLEELIYYVKGNSTINTNENVLVIY